MKNVNELTNNELICRITDDIIKNDIKVFSDLVNHVKAEYKDKGVILVATKTTFFKELIDSNYKIWKGA